MREAIFNHFNQAVWDSFARDDVDNKFRFALAWMRAALDMGIVEIMQAGDYFGRNIFRRDPVIGEHHRAFDPLRGVQRAFFRDRLYFFATNESAHGTIRRAQIKMGSSPLAVGEVYA